MIDNVRSLHRTGYAVRVSQPSTHHLGALGFQQIGTAGRPRQHPDRKLPGQQVSHQGRPQETRTASYADTHAIAPHVTTVIALGAGQVSPRRPTSF